MHGVAMSAAVFAVVGSLVAACGSPNAALTARASAAVTALAPVSGNTAGHNRQDVMFAERMTLHDRETVALAMLVPGRAFSDQVKGIAAQIEVAQMAQIKTMSGWLTTWGAKVPGTKVPGAKSNSLERGLPGSISGTDLQHFARLHSTVFDRAYLQTMIKHLHGAISMAKDERVHGAYTPAKHLATSIISTQSAQMETMRRLQAMSVEQGHA
ncbi:DUF305 domain-containing protein [Nonomuraea sp. CA-141351]|uniref:DUF305 domain-containing protein n=1 Tax=Nonomuraea sp. CA-141351 TaxID=3239996 RepID=UPI003D949E99